MEQCLPTIEEPSRNEQGSVDRIAIVKRSWRTILFCSGGKSIPAPVERQKVNSADINLLQPTSLICEPESGSVLYGVPPVPPNQWFDYFF